MSKYETLVTVLDKLRMEAPLEYKRYRPLDTDIEKLNQARSKAFIHLFLKVKFGLLDFREREGVITEGSYDGGVDAYYIDSNAKKIYLIQSKFRTNENNFQQKEIQLEELLNMDVDRITKGELKDEDGNEYNSKIKQLIREISEIGDSGRYSYEVVILANLTNVNPSKLKKLTGGFSAVVFDYERTYKELLFPIIIGTYYNPSELIISINLSNKNSSNARISYNVATGYKDCDITVLFVPTLEIAKTMYKYRNSILKYNPRSYLELSNNTVNKDIAKTITGLTTNEFALFNNGITMLSYGTAFNEKIGKKDRAQLIITQPQIINGGQTAFTLSRLYEENLGKDNSEQLFSDKEVLLKVITFHHEDADDDAKQLRFIEAISKATNSQTPVDDADRHSNDSIQIEMQDRIFNEYGYFYERKRGEYADGIRAGYINRSKMIDREIFLRLCMSCDFNPSKARSAGAKKLFSEENFNSTMKDVSRFKEYFFAFKCYEQLNAIEKTFSQDRTNSFGLINYGHGLRYGKFAVIAACRLKYQANNSLTKVDSIVNEVLDRWLGFESYITDLPSNNSYFRFYVDQDSGVEKQELNFDGYYKGRTINNDLKQFFKDLA